MEELKEVGIKSSIAFVGKIVQMLIMMVSGIILGKLLGASLYGSFTYIISFLSAGIIVATLGLSSGLSAFLPKYSKEDRDKKDSLTTFSIYIVGVTCTIIVIIVFLNRSMIQNVFFKDPKYNSVFNILLPSIIIVSLNTVLASVFRATRNVKVYAINTNILLPLSRLILFVIFFMLYGKDIKAIINAYYASLVISFVYLIYNLYKNKHYSSLKNKYFPEYKALLVFSLPLLLNGIVMILLYNIDIYMIGYFYKSVDVGIYKMALNIGNLGSFALLSVNIIFPSMVSKLYHQKKMNELAKIYKITTKAITIVSLLVLSGVICLKVEIMSIIGNEYISGSVVLLIIVIGQLINAIVGSVGIMNAMTGHPKYNLYTNLLVLVLNIIMNFILIPRYGIVGAAIATAISVAIANIVKVILLYRKLKIQPYNISFTKVFIPLVVSTCVGLIVKNILKANYFVEFVVIGSIIVIVFVLITMFYVLSKRERIYLINLFKRRDMNIQKT